MITIKHFLTTTLLLLVALSYGQDYAYVNADSGLTSFSFVPAVVELLR